MNKLLLAVTGFLTFLVFLVAMTPASLVHSSLKEALDTNAPALKLYAIDGTVWQGSGEVAIRDLPPVRLAWDTSALSAARGAFVSDINVTAIGLNASLETDVSTSGGELAELNAEISSDYLNQITVEYGLDLSGEVQIDGANLAFDREWLTDAGGRMHWTGGIVHIQTPEQIHTVRLPDFDGELSMDGNQLVLAITHDGEDMLEIRLKPDGWAKVDVQRALVELAQLPLPAATGSNDGSAIVIEEKIL